MRLKTKERIRWVKQENNAYSTYLFCSLAGACLYVCSIVLYSIYHISYIIRGRDRQDPEAYVIHTLRLQLSFHPASPISQVSLQPGLDDSSLFPQAVLFQIRLTVVDVSLGHPRVYLRLLVYYVSMILYCDIPVAVSISDRRAQIRRHAIREWRFGTYKSRTQITHTLRSQQPHASLHLGLENCSDLKVSIQS